MRYIVEVEHDLSDALLKSVHIDIQLLLIGVARKYLHFQATLQTLEQILWQFTETLKPLCKAHNLLATIKFANYHQASSVHIDVQYKHV